MKRTVLRTRRPRGWRMSWLFGLALATTAAAGLAACSTGTSSIPQCEDGLDNDSDGFTDLEDFACQVNPAGKESPDPPHACEDGIDNDADGHTDFPDDPNCTDALDQDEFGPIAPGCMDTIDNDGDGETDYPNDPGCLVPNQNSEEDDCPDGESCPECGNGVDDDFDGNTDFGGSDEGCANAADNTEFDLQPNACGTGVNIQVLPGTNGTLNAAIPSQNSQQSSMTCGGSGAETAFVLMVPRPSTLVVSAEGTTDTVIYIRRNCAMPATELACNDNDPAANPPTVGSKVTLDVAPGSYFIVVDGKGLATTGPFTLNWALYVGQGETCNGPAECAPGYLCRTVPGAPAMTCELPVCSDGRDDDMDGVMDFPADPGCTAGTDSTEEDDCPDGPNCPDCGNQMDDDGDMLIDYPNDPSCSSASSATEQDCPIEVDPLLAIDAAFESGTTVGAGANLGPHGCGGTTSAPDRVYTLAVRAPLATLVLDLSDSPAGTTDYDSVLALYDPLCAAVIACDDDGGSPGSESMITRANVAVGNYSVVVDGFGGGSGHYTLRAYGTYGAIGDACDPLSPWFTCPAGNACSGAPGTATCQPAQCNNTMDDDGDGDTDFPNDPGCTSTNDGTEMDDCPNGPNCPQCGNGIDDDGDGNIDFPADTGCTSASTSSESCVTSDPVRNLTVPQLTLQSTVPLANDIDLSCGTDGRDEVYRIVVDNPIDMLRVDTVGSIGDMVVGIKAGTCAATDLACDDNGGGGNAAQATVMNPAVGEYYIVVDDKNATNPGTYGLRVTGHYPNNGRCTPNTPFTCNAGFACTGAAGAEMCTGAACNNQLDDDGDGAMDYPNDPGCANSSDDDETDDCPAGPNCPACGNDVDDDMDGLTDFPADPACTAASTASELAPCTSMDPVIVFQQNVQGATTMGKANDVDLSCGVDGRDEIYRLLINQPLVSLTVDTFASDNNTAVALRRGTCNGTTDLVCGTNNFGTNDARAVLNNVTPGEYFAIVDDLNTATPTLYNLNVRGVLVGMAACTPGSVNFVCDTGFTCQGPPGNAFCAPGPCADNVDQDGDGRVGFPSDPGCTSTSDPDEADDCNLPNGPAGPNCPACSNTVDDDTDTHTDYPDDLACSLASGTTENKCPVEAAADGLLVVDAAVLQGTTTGAMNNFGGHTCQGTSNAPDRAYLLPVRAPLASMTLDLSDSAAGTTDFDSIIDVYKVDCSAPIAGYCDDDSGTPGTESLLTRTNVEIGTYTVVVDGFSTGMGNYTLRVSGTYPSGGACDVMSPWFACPAGQACNAGVCQ